MCLALTPESPEVQAAVKKAVTYLAATRIEGGGGGTDPTVGTKALVALAMVKGGANQKHAVIQGAIQAIRGNLKSEELTSAYACIYSSSVSLLLLTAVDKDAYQREIGVLLGNVLRHQLGHGGFASSPTEGDTSMTQYAILSMWEASEAGIPVSAAAWQKAAAWLLETQIKKDGGFCYNPPGGETTPSMTAGGAGSMYICMARNRPAQPTRSGPKLPPALQRVQERRESRPTIPLPNMTGAAAKAGAWLQKRGMNPPKEYPLYYFYAMERYYSFKEFVEFSQEKEPAWYTDGARQLLKSQKPNGSWTAALDTETAIRTAFGVLFLVRSTRKSLHIEEAGSGELIGGRGLPDSAALEMRNGAVVVKPLSGPADELLDAMADPNDPKFAQAAEGLLNRMVEKDEVMLPAQLVRLRKLSGSGSWQARAAAVTALGRAGKLDDVPTLIFALSDEDARVAAAARDGLRFISRKFDGFGLDFSVPADQRPRVVAEATEKWKQWYRSVRPDARFEEPQPQ